MQQNKIINYLCFLMSILVFSFSALTIMNELKGENGGVLSEEIVSGGNIFDYYLENGYYENTNNQNEMFDLEYDVDASGNYGTESVKKAISDLAYEIARSKDSEKGYAFSVESFANVLSVPEKYESYAVKAYNYSYAEEDIKGNRYIEFGAHSTSDFAKQNNTAQKTSIINNYINIKNTSQIELNGRKIVGNFNNASTFGISKNSFIEKNKFEPKTFNDEFFVYENLNLNKCFLIKSGSGYKLTLDINSKGYANFLNDFIRRDSRFILGTEKVEDYKVSLTFSKQGRIMLFETKAVLRTKNKDKAPIIGITVTADVKHTYEAVSYFKYLKSDYVIKAI